MFYRLAARAKRWPMRRTPEDSFRAICVFCDMRILMKGPAAPAKLTAQTCCVSFSSTDTGGFMKLSTRKIGEIVVIDVDGKILLGDGDVEIKKTVDELLKKGGKNILLNLARVPYLDSAGLGEIIRCFTALRRSGGNFKLLSPNQRIIDLLSITKLLNVFDWYDNEDTALKSFSK
jgi:anti-sigma B factor antagonist